VSSRIAHLKAQRQLLSAKGFANYLLDYYGPLIHRHLQGRGNLPQEELEYTVEKVALLKDSRLQQDIATLIGWGDEERAELETFCAIALEVFRHTPPSRLREAARIVEIRSLMVGADRVAPKE
jgi:hypothetical protein